MLFILQEGISGTEKCCSEFKFDFYMVNYTVVFCVRDLITVDDGDNRLYILAM